MKRNKNNGFTLAELLIVVAIIGVLVAISIPIFSGQLDKAKIATDQANVRSAKAAALAQYLTYDFGEPVVTYYYDAARGNVKYDSSGIEGYGKYTKNDKEAEIGASGTPNKDGKANFVYVTVDGSTNEVSCFWGTGNGYAGYYSVWNSFKAANSEIFADHSKDYAGWYPSGDNTVAIYMANISKFGSNQNRQQADNDGLQQMADSILKLNYSDIMELTGGGGRFDTNRNEHIFRYNVDSTGTINYTSAWQNSGALLEYAGYDSVEEINRNNNVLGTPIFYSDEALAVGSHNVTLYVKKNSDGSLSEVTVTLNNPDGSKIVKTASK